MPRLHIFNPDTDFALAAKSDFYTPPGRVTALRRSLALLPALYASAGDAILLLDPFDEEELSRLPHYQLVLEKSLGLVSLPAKGEAPSAALKGFRADPWGWNECLRRLLLSRFDGLEGIPSEAGMKEIKRLSHRRLTIPFLDGWDEAETPREFTDAGEAMEYCRQRKRLFFKAPWSSSGRGVVRTADLEERHILPWLCGTIEAQGSVMAEPEYARRLDFATEWKAERGKARFMGFSVFETSPRGKYKGNLRLPQAELRGMIEEAANEGLDKVLEYQRDRIEMLIAPHYDGPLGIDCLVTNDGRINPCVEVNLRRTMGMIGLKIKG